MSDGMRENFHCPTCWKPLDFDLRVLTGDGEKNPGKLEVTAYHKHPKWCKYSAVAIVGVKSFVEKTNREG